eukprot:1153726-Pelagomonas_calceolata.AAC.2
MEFPVQLLIRFWVNHHLLDLFQRPLWRVVKGRSKSYVDKVLQGDPLTLSTDKDVLCSKSYVDKVLQGDPLTLPTDKDVLCRQGTQNLYVDD